MDQQIRFLRDTMEVADLERYLHAYKAKFPFTREGSVGHQVRGWTAWHRHITLAMLALALLAGIAATQPPNTNDERIPLTLPEIRRLLTALILTTTHPTTDILRWSDWRRRHQRRSQP
ncbi:hypothetical protein [Nonomuraea sp. B19D2]|uniref:hypothetical protein n=1 Tax=Nonomuraea sp. B19D2 TaxID=3159561 RepID=UPI0032DA1CE2